MVSGFRRYRARTHKKQAGIMNVEGTLLLVLLLHDNGIECPVSLAGGHGI
jgi:hypothetical protein